MITFPKTKAHDNFLVLTEIVMSFLYIFYYLHIETSHLYDMKLTVRDTGMKFLL